MRILVTFAHDSEFAPWRRRRHFERAADGGFRTRLGETELRVVLTGMGPANAARVVAQALERRPDACISSGLAGGLRREHRCGTVLLAERVCEAETLRWLESNASLVALAIEKGARRVEAFCTSGELIQTAAGKARLGRIADAVDMESYAVLYAAEARSVPAVAIRAISDSVEQDLPMDFSRVLDAQGRIRYRRLVGNLAKSPRRIPGMIRLGIESRRASERLAAFLDSFAVVLSAQPGTVKVIAGAASA